MPERTPQIALIGFMGTGKSTVGPLLAARLGYDFFDLDVLVAARAGLSIPEIFAREGEPAFRRREREMLLAVSGRPGQILATGGGVVLDPANVAALRAGGLVVWLNASLSAILSRVGRGGGRPLLAEPEPSVAVARLLAEREHLYRGAADLTVDTTGLPAVEVADRVADWSRLYRRGVTS